MADDSERDRAVEIARTLLAGARYVMAGQRPDAWPTPEQFVLLAQQYLIAVGESDAGC